MKILFIHPNFPGQFKHIAKHLAKDPENEVVFACTYPNKLDIAGVKKVISKPDAPKKGSKIHRYVAGFEKATYAAQSMWRLCNGLKKSGFVPDVIYAHPGWGDGMLLKDVYPDVPYIAYMEFYYQAFGADMHFNPNDKIDDDKVARARIKNATNLINLTSCDWAISPTQFQASLHPKDFHHKFSVIHEGVDTNVLNPDIKPTELLLPNGAKLPDDAEIVTYVARNFEPYRGFEQVMRAIEILMQKHPKAHFLMIGGDDVSYGAKLSGGKTYRQKMLHELNLDNERIYWYGKVPYSQMINILKHSMAHIYMSVPFVLSWSFIEAMALGCPIVASDVSMLREVITDKHNALMVQFFKPEDIAEKTSILLNKPELRKKYSINARKTALEKYSLDKLLPVYEKLIGDIANGACVPADAEDLKINF